MSQTLKRLLAKQNIPQAQLAKAILQPNGKPLSLAAISLLLNHGIYPRSMTKGAIDKQIAEFTKDKGIQQPYTIEAALDSHSKTAALQKQEESEMRKESLSQNALLKFKLKRNPFTNDINSRDDVYRSEGLLYTEEMMYETALRGGFIAVVGESGSGKSTVRKDLIERLDGEGADVNIIMPAGIDKRRVTAADICDSILIDVGNYTKPEKPKLPQKLEHKSRHAVQVLEGSCKTGGKHCLIIEEAHDLHTMTLKHLKRLWELEYKSGGFRKLLSIILIGQPELKELLNEKNYAAREVVRRCELVEIAPLSPDEIRAYLQIKFARQQIDVSKVFDESAYEAIYMLLNENLHIGSYPLIINNLAVAALNKAAHIGMEYIDADLVMKFAVAGDR